MTADRFKQPHRRYNPLTGEWVLVSPQRSNRPWQGKNEREPGDNRPDYDPSCYLCPGNVRANGEKNPVYTNTFVFPNDFPAIVPGMQESPDSPESAESPARKGSLLRSAAIRGECSVICFSPVHRLTLPEMPEAGILDVVNVWASEVGRLGERYRWVQVFENKGEIMGCSNPHPHCQVWGGSFLPNELERESIRQGMYYGEKKSALLLDYLEEELVLGARTVIMNEHWVALVPFWAVWPFETLLLPRRHVLRFPELTTDERLGLAEIMKRLLSRYDNIFGVSFPYTMGWHGAPFDDGDYRGWQLHAHYYPPLLRSATVRKFMVGYEMLAEAQRDITQEQAASWLRELPDIHYKLRSGASCAGDREGRRV